MKTIREEKFGKATVGLIQKDKGYTALTISGGKISGSIDGDDREDVWKRATADVGKTAPGFWGYEDAKERFLAHFPVAFKDPGYVDSERDYKMAAASYIEQHIPLNAARNPTPALCQHAVKAIQKTNMATPIEKTRVHALLLSQDGPAFLEAAADLADGKSALALPRLDALMRKQGQPSWPCATYLPFFWKPHDAMFLKPQITQMFAERVGHRFVHDYDARLNADTYNSLLDLAAECEREIAELNPRDRIDVQSFIWVVGDYPDPAVQQ